MDAVACGMLLGIGLLLIASSIVGTPVFHVGVPVWWRRWEDQITRAEIPGLTPWRLIAASIFIALLVGVLVFAWTRVWVVALVLVFVVAPTGQFMVVSRAQRRAKVLRRAWPDVVDTLVSGVRAGAGLPDLLCDLSTNGPEVLRPHFKVFAAEYRVSGRFSNALDALKNRCADPVADRIVEALRIARDVGGSDLSTLLRNLGVLLREDARIRGELEARQSWTVNAARLAVAAPWIVLVLVSSQSGAAHVWDTQSGMTVLLVGALICLIAYGLMKMLGRLTSDRRNLG